MAGGAFRTGPAESRARLVEAALAERRRLERDLHDGVQQDLVGIRIKLDLVASAVRADRAEAEQLLRALGEQLDDALRNLRAFAHGIYPVVLRERGLPDALRSAALNVAAPVSVRAFDVGRHAEAIEVAVYFCCLEALQNATKHAGPEVPVTIKLSERRGSLRFEVRDIGCGFDLSSSAGGNGLLNMRDRIEAIGGRLVIGSVPGLGTSVKGSVPVAGTRGRVRMAAPYVPSRPASVARSTASDRDAAPSFR
jgi:signal transduction histidine kinase